VVVTAAAVMAFVSQSSFASEPKLRTSALRRITASRAIDARYFEPGACVEYPPASGDRHLTVFLDAGHGGLDPGGVGETQSGETIYEADETLPVELDTMTLLRAKGFTVVVSRTKAETVIRPRPGDVSGGLFTVQGEHDDVAARDICANMAKANVLVGIYFDAGGSPYNAGAVTGYDTARSFSAQNLRLATLIQNDVLGAMNAQGWGIPDLGVTDDSQLGGPALSTAAADYGHLLLLGPAEPGWFTTPSQMPGALIEPLFITDPFEGTLAASPSGQEVIAGGLAQAIEQYLAPASGAKGPRLQRDARFRGISTEARKGKNTGRVRGNGSSWAQLVTGGILALVVTPKIGPWRAAGQGSHRRPAQHGSRSTPLSSLLVGSSR
jgi:N-acetylmuramoyl-L-alanine amidase